MVSIRRVQHVSITRPRGSEAQTRAFYGEALGLQEIPRPTSLAHLDLIWFKASDDGDELHLVAEDSPVNTGSGRHYCLVVDDVAAMRARLEGRGYAIEETTPIPNRPRFFCRDPFGNNIEFTTILGPYD
jgi:catechol 2,3-dioxygenase-like lactoylglutathione lyase family enzyme